MENTGCVKQRRFPEDNIIVAPDSYLGRSNKPGS